MEKQAAFQNCDMLNFNPEIDLMLWWLAFFILPMPEILQFQLQAKLLNVIFIEYV